MKKKYFYLPTNFFADPKIKQIEKLKSGSNHIVIWLKLIALASKKDDCGVIHFKNRPYTVDMLSFVLRESPSSIKEALDTFVKYGMIKMKNGIIYVQNWRSYNEQCEVD